jgi:hypothetical protein
MSDLQDIIATQSIRAFNMGVERERERIIKMIEELTSFAIERETMIAMIKGKND